MLLSWRDTLWWSRYFSSFDQ